MLLDDDKGMREKVRNSTHSIPLKPRPYCSATSEFVWRYSLRMPLPIAIPYNVEVELDLPLNTQYARQTFTILLIKESPNRSSILGQHMLVLTLKFKSSTPASIIFTRRSESVGP